MKTHTIDLQRRLGHAMQKRREALKLTQAHASERARVSLKYYGEVERGEANVTVRTLARITGALDWDPWTLFATAQQPVSQPVHGLVLAELTVVATRLNAMREWFASLDPTRRTEDESDDGECWERFASTMNTAIAVLADAGLDEAALRQSELCPVMTALTDSLQGNGLEPSDEMRAHLETCETCTEQMRRLFARDVRVTPCGREAACPIMAAFVSEQPSPETGLTVEMRTHVASCEVCIEEIAELGVSRALDRLRQGFWKRRRRDRP